MNNRSIPVCIIILAASVLLLTPAVARAQATPDSTDLVVLIHGMGRTSLSMIPMEISLESAGLRVLNFHYSSYGPSVAEIANGLGRRIDGEVARHPTRRVHFVGHSLGNIVVRWLLANQRPAAEIGRLVMLAPPNRGSRVADKLARYVGWLLAPIAELKTAGSTVAKLPPPQGVEVMIIAGKWDNKVSLAETCLQEAKAHVVVDAGHTFIVMHPKVMKMARRFILDGIAPPPDTTVTSPCTSHEPDSKIP